METAVSVKWLLLQGLLPGVEVLDLSAWTRPASAQSMFSSSLDSLSEAAGSFSP